MDPIDVERLRRAIVRLTEVIQEDIKTREKSMSELKKLAGI